MKQVRFRFYEELNDFLPASRKKQEFIHSFQGDPSVKDSIESMGVPHTEVDMILVNGESVGFSYKLKNNDQVSVYPVFESFDISDIQHLRPDPLREIKFVADVHLGRLAKYLRLLGFDTVYDKELEDGSIISISLSEKRIILTRDLGILKNGKIIHGYWIRSTAPVKQLNELVKRFNLINLFKPFTRCLECNTEVADVSMDEVNDRLLPETRKYYELFRICPGCKRIYWKGSHYEKMKHFIKELTLDKK